jgi:sulfopyruvate decarboxylase TPP-binding subunit
MLGCRWHNAAAPMAFGAGAAISRAHRARPDLAKSDVGLAAQTWQACAKRRLIGPREGPPDGEEDAVKELIKQYLDNGISRRKLVSGLTTIGMSAVAARAMAQNLAPAAAPAATATGPGARREMTGTGGALLVAQLKAAGVKYIFFNPSTGDSPIFDALVDEPGIQLIKGVQEGAVVAMADGYARATGKPAVVVVANIGLPNAMTQMVNSWKDNIPLIVAVASVGQEELGHELTQETEHVELMTQPITKWFWNAQSTATIPETVRNQVQLDAAVRAGVPVAAHQHAARPGQGRHHGSGQVRRADAYPPRQSRR